MIKKISNKDDEFFMQTAFNLSKKSHCVSKKVGVVLAKDGRIISMGYNGSHPGNINCDDVFNRDDMDFEKHHEWSRVFEVHAEMNCLAFAAKNGIKVDGCTLYVTLSPCQDCLKNLMQAGIKRIVFLVHRNTLPEELMTYMTSNDIILEQLVPQKMFLTKENCAIFHRANFDSMTELIEDSIRYHTAFIPDKDLDLKHELNQRFQYILKDLNE
jgi:dCMP deaminase